MNFGVDITLPDRKKTMSYHLCTTLIECTVDIHTQSYGTSSKSFNCCAPWRSL